MPWHQHGDEQLQAEPADHRPVVDPLAGVTGKKGDAQDERYAEKTLESFHGGWERRSM